MLSIDKINLFAHISRNCFVMLYKSLVRSHLEYANSVWYAKRNKNSSGDEIANVNLLTTISHTRRPTLKPTSFNELDDRLASTAHEVLNFSICYRISTSQLFNIPVASRGLSADDVGTNRKLI